MRTSADWRSSMGEGCATAPFAISPRSLSLLLLWTWTSFLFERRLVANALPILPRPKIPTRAISDKPRGGTFIRVKIRLVASSRVRRSQIQSLRLTSRLNSFHHGRGSRYLRERKNRDSRFDKGLLVPISEDRRIKQNKSGLEDIETRQEALGDPNCVPRKPIVATCSDAVATNLNK